MGMVGLWGEGFPRGVEYLGMNGVILCRGDIVSVPRGFPPVGCRPCRPRLHLAADCVQTTRVSSVLDPCHPTPHAFDFVDGQKPKSPARRGFWLKLKN